MREALALIRSSWVTAASYRVGMLLSLVGLVFVVLPLYFIANALQPAMQHAIVGEGSQYFSFVVLGAIAFSLISTCTTSLPSALGGAIDRGTLEVMLGTPARIWAICVGLMGYGILWATLRAAILFGVAISLGAGVVWSHIPLGIGVLALTMVSYAGIGLVFAALILTFRTTGPLSAVVLTASMFLGGVYYPTHVIPSWLQHVASAFPLTYGLHALRHLVLRGDSLITVIHDIQMLGAMTVVSMAIGVGVFSLALRHARQAGTLSSY